MNKIKPATIALITTASLMAAFSFTSSAMDTYTESALIDVCKTSVSNNRMQFNAMVKSYHLKNKTVALKVMCNGDDIATFAEKHGANKIAAMLEHSLGAVSITDVAAITKINVTFAE